MTELERLKQELDDAVAARAADYYAARDALDAARALLLTLLLRNKP